MWRVSGLFACQAYPWEGGGVEFGPRLMAGGDICGGMLTKGLVACETTGAPTLLRAFLSERHELAQCEALSAITIVYVCMSV